MGFRPESAGRRLPPASAPEGAVRLAPGAPTRLLGRRETGAEGPPEEGGRLPHRTRACPPPSPRRNPPEALPRGPSPAHLPAPRFLPPASPAQGGQAGGDGVLRPVSLPRSARGSLPESGSRPGPDLAGAAAPPPGPFLFAPVLHTRDHESSLGFNPESDSPRANVLGGPHSGLCGLPVPTAPAEPRESPPRPRGHCSAAAHAPARRPPAGTAARWAGPRPREALTRGFQAASERGSVCLRLPAGGGVGGQPAAGAPCRSAEGERDPRAEGSRSDARRRAPGAPPRTARGCPTLRPAHWCASSSPCGEECFFLEIPPSLPGEEERVESSGGWIQVRVGVS